MKSWRWLWMDKGKTCPITGKECFPWKCMWGAVNEETGLHACGLLVAVAHGEGTIPGRRKEEECESAS